jgi:hypothetical protein
VHVLHVARHFLSNAILASGLACLSLALLPSAT